MAKTVEQVLQEMQPPFTPAALQIEDATNAAAAGRYLVCTDVGCGKTLVGTITMKMWDEDHNLILCPPILLDQWESWLHTVNEKNTSIYRGAKRSAEMLDAKWVIMSHAIFRNSFEEIDHHYRKASLAVIVDEAHALKNPASKLYRSVSTLVLPNRPIIMLTATPTSKPEDTYAYMKLKTPKLYRSMGHWGNLHVEARDIFNTITKYGNLDLLAKNFAIQTVKRTKKEVFGYDLSAIYAPIVYKLSDAHYKLYLKLAEEQLLLLPAGEKIDATTSQRLRHALQQIVVNYERFSGDPKDRSTAYDLLDEVIEEVNPMDPKNSKLIIWTYYQATSKAVTAYLRGIYGDEAVAAAYGAVDSHKGVREIMNNPLCRMFVAQPSSVGAGLNLQHCASENLFLEMATTPLQIRQALGRTERMGQTVRPTMRFAQAKGTIQIRLFQDLLKNDDLVTRVERTEKSLRQEIFGVT